MYMRGHRMGSRPGGGWTEQDTLPPLDGYATSHSPASTARLHLDDSRKKGWKRQGEEDEGSVSGKEEKKKEKNTKRMRVRVWEGRS